MSLSYYPNCPASHDDHFDLDVPPPTLLDHLLTPPPDNTFNDFYNHHQLFDPTDFFYSSETPVFFDDGLFPNPSYNYYEPAEFPNGPPVYSDGVRGGPKERAGLSAQSVAARQRRRKITEKTRELGKLVPGGQKMNTAEMLQGAYKYIKFLQAQVGILEFVRETGGGNDKLHDLLVSEAVQEKLYSAEKCLVPSGFVEEIGGGDGVVGDVPRLVSFVTREV